MGEQNEDKPLMSNFTEGQKGLTKLQIVINHSSRKYSKNVSEKLRQIFEASLEAQRVVIQHSFVRTKSR